MLILKQALGNHEFDNGPDGLQPLLAIEKLPNILCSNIRSSAKVPEKIKQYETLNVGDASVAIIGYLTPEVQVLARTGKGS